jgi:hypothetical protein
MLCYTDQIACVRICRLTDQWTHGILLNKDVVFREECLWFSDRWIYKSIDCTALPLRFTESVVDLSEIDAQCEKLTLRIPMPNVHYDTVTVMLPLGSYEEMIIVMNSKQRRVNRRQPPGTSCQCTVLALDIQPSDAKKMMKFLQIEVTDIHTKAIHLAPPVGRDSTVVLKDLTAPRPHTFMTLKLPKHTTQLGKLICSSAYYPHLTVNPPPKLLHIGHLGLDGIVVESMMETKRVDYLHLSHQSERSMNKGIPGMVQDLKLEHCYGALHTIGSNLTSLHLTGCDLSKIQVDSLVDLKKLTLAGCIHPCNTPFVLPPSVNDLHISSYSEPWRVGAQRTHIPAQWKPMYAFDCSHVTNVSMLTLDVSWDDILCFDPPIHTDCLVYKCNASSVSIPASTVYSKLVLRMPDNAPPADTLILNLTNIAEIDVVHCGSRTADKRPVRKWGFKNIHHNDISETLPRSTVRINEKMCVVAHCESCIHT